MRLVSIPFASTYEITMALYSPRASSISGGRTPPPESPDRMGRYVRAIVSIASIFSWLACPRLLAPFSTRYQGLFSTVGKNTVDGSVLKRKGVAP
jgi:hypothetical protein